MRLLHTLLLVLLACTAPAFAATDPFAQPPAAGGSLLGGEEEFLPVEQAYPLEASFADGELRLMWNITPGYYLYRKRMSLRVAGDPEAPPLLGEWPHGEPHEDAYLGATEVYRGVLEVAAPFAPSAPTRIEVKSQGCADAGLCYPPRTQLFEVDPASGRVSEIAPLARAALSETAGAAASAAVPRGSLAFMALLAALGGLILNLMPCVFPVLSLKVLSIAQKGGSAAAAGRVTHGLAYTAGVVLSFVSVAALLLVLRGAGQAIGWGFHLQSPTFVGALAYLFLAMGLGLSGLVNFGAGLMGVGNALAVRGGYAGTFFTGVLATVVASPCSAPFMGTALGYALTQSALPALTVFAALGFGMAAPFLLLTASPRLLARLPHPGAWMEGFKQFLAFPLYAAAVWLLWVLGKQTGVDGMAWVLAGAVLLALGLWVWERAPRHRHPLAFRAGGAAALALALAMLGSPQLHEDRRPEAARAGDWEPFTPERLAELRAARSAVFVNITADWCITCLANEKIALDTEAVREVFRSAGVHYLKGDWTNADPVISEFLRANGRSGVPLYLYYPPRTGALPVVLPQLLTPALVSGAITAR